MKHSELRSTCRGSVTEVPDVRNFWESLKLVTMRYFLLPKNGLQVRNLTEQWLIRCLRTASDMPALIRNETFLIESRQSPTTSKLVIGSLLRACPPRGRQHDVTIVGLN